MTLQDALAKAAESDLDLVEVAPTAKPPVCRIMDYGKFRYEQQRKDREARKKQKTFDVKAATDDIRKAITENNKKNLLVKHFCLTRRFN